MQGHPRYNCFFDYACRVILTFSLKSKKETSVFSVLINFPHRSHKFPTPPKEFPPQKQTPHIKMNSSKHRSNSLIRRNRPPKTPRKNKKNGNSSLSSLDFNNSFSSITSDDRMHSSTGTNMAPDDDLDFLTKSSGAHRWRNKKHWKTISVTKRYDDISTITPFSTPQSEESVMRRSTIRESLKGVLNSIDIPDL